MIIFLDKGKIRRENQKLHMDLFDTMFFLVRTRERCFSTREQEFE
jgi:hypothetical protein